MTEFGCVFYAGPSLLTGDPIVGIVTGLDKGSSNVKTGAIAQSWILRSDMPPMDAKRANVDDAVCGDCKLRGRNGRDSGCYVPAWVAPHQVYKSFIAGVYPTVSWTELQAVLEGRIVRLGAYGDPAAIPFDVRQVLLATTAGHVAYTHSWRRCDPRFKAIAMASVDDEREFFDAGLRGWRTFRVRLPGEPLIAGAEFVCPASDEANRRVTCSQCLLCRGTSSPARSVVIVAHGKPSSLKAFGLTPSSIKNIGRVDNSHRVTFHRNIEARP